MVNPSVPSPARLSNTRVSLQRRTTSVSTVNNGLNTAFYFPDDDFQAEIRHTKSLPNQPSQWELEHPLAIRWLHFARDIVYILFALLLLEVTGAGNYMHKRVGGICENLFWFLL
ncbi:hypothetical protein L5515_000984 [Caenorhabditis briggsae]|uniref:Uncharacterized protein n=1 Tax=Caenorhabditis briggsae TaxID=6238 RepID=A0AAE9E1H6_CAEBR|nr:hypothetical protein L3Y34_014906 [Caenorhabditis briggsae]UMM11970.1 hypothetical protein L5515_000984 [Caenorhabditis briggsae]